MATLRQTSESSAESPLVSQVQETARCRDCGAEFERHVLIVGPARMTVHRCEKCDEAEVDPEVAALRKPAQSTEDWLDSIGVNTRKHGSATIENFDASDAPKAPGAAHDFIAEVVASRRHDRVKGLYLVGSAKGTGKTHLAVAIMRAVHEQRPDVGVVFDPADRLITKIQDSYGSGTTDALIEIRRNAGLYVLDDLGREKDSVDALRTLCTILDEREGAPTVITSNNLPRALGDRAKDADLWARVASRLGDEVYRYVAVEGRDRRFAA